MSNNFGENSILNEIELEIQKCEVGLLERRGNAVKNIKSMFSDPMERSIAVFLHNAFMFYTWDETLAGFRYALNNFISSISNKSIIFVFHSEASSSTSQNMCHQKSSFFFTLLALRLIPGLRNRTIGYICNDLHTMDPKKLKGRSDVVYCICEDSIYSGTQIDSVILGLQKNKVMALSDLHVVCPFVRSTFVEQSFSKGYTLHTGHPDLWVPSLMERLSDESVISKTCNQVSELVEREGETEFSRLEICDDNLTHVMSIFPHRMRQVPVSFSHKTADATSIPLPWLLGILGLGVLSREDADGNIANDYVKDSTGSIFSCLRGPYKNHTDELKTVFDNIFAGSKVRKKSLITRLLKK